MKQYLPYAIIGIFIIIIIGFIAKCSRNKDVNKHNEVRLNIVNDDIFKSAADNKYRDSIVKRNKALELALSKKEIQYIPIKIKADSVVKKYIKQPTITHCNDAIVVLKMQNTIADSIIGDLKQIVVNKDTLIASQGRTIAKKDKTISDFNTAFINLNEDFKQAKKPKRFGLGVQAGVGVSKTITPTPYIGIGVSYNLIRL